MLNNLRAYVAKDGTVYKGDIYKMCRIIKKEIKASRSSFDSIINIDEYSIIDPNELLTASSIAFAGFVTSKISFSLVHKVHIFLRRPQNFAKYPPNI